MKKKEITKIKNKKSNSNINKKDYIEKKLKKIKKL